MLQADASRNVSRFLLFVLPSLGFMSGCDLPYATLNKGEGGSIIFRSILSRSLFLAKLREMRMGN